MCEENPHDLRDDQHNAWRWAGLLLTALEGGRSWLVPIEQRSRYHSWSPTPCGPCTVFGYFGLVLSDDGYKTSGTYRQWAIAEPPLRRLTKLRLSC
jgi:hypothetical protein